MDRGLEANGMACGCSGGGEPARKRGARRHRNKTTHTHAHIQNLPVVRSRSTRSNWARSDGTGTRESAQALVAAATCAYEWVNRVDEVAMRSMRGARPRPGTRLLCTGHDAVVVSSGMQLWLLASFRVRRPELAVPHAGTGRCCWSLARVWAFFSALSARLIVVLRLEMLTDHPRNHRQITGEGGWLGGEKILHCGPSP